jgi:hypothetical protein
MNLAKEIYVKNAFKWAQKGKSLIDLAHFARGAEEIFKCEDAEITCIECGYHKMSIRPYDSGKGIAWECFECGEINHKGIV